MNMEACPQHLNARENVFSKPYCFFFKRQPTVCLGVVCHRSWDLQLPTKPPNEWETKTAGSSFAKPCDIAVYCRVAPAFTSNINAWGLALDVPAKKTPCRKKVPCSFDGAESLLQ